MKQKHQRLKKKLKQKYQRLKNKLMQMFQRLKSKFKQNQTLKKKRQRVKKNEL